MTDPVPERTPVLALDGVSKSFGAVRALREVSLALYAGEAHALAGENGAGKSTLIKILAGVHPQDAGTITYYGTPVTADDVLFTIAWPNWYPTSLKQFGLEMYRNVKGGENGTGTAIEAGTIPEGVKKIDDHTVEITLFKPDGTFIRRLAGAYYYIQPVHILGDLTGEPISQPIERR